jgi:hypothetical protein
MILKKELSTSRGLCKMYSKKELEHLRYNDEINDSDEGFMLGYLSAYDSEN